MQNDYVNVLKEHVIELLTSGSTTSLNEFVANLIAQNETDQTQIMAAHLEIKQEILGY